MLRPYQQEGVDAIWRALFKPDPVLCVASTGAGKTEMFVELIRRAGVKSAVLVGRDKLVEQTARRLRAVVPSARVWSAGQGEREVGDVTVVSVHSADELTIDGLRLLVVDEAHNLNSGRYASFLERHKGAKLVGFTATPWRNGIEIFGTGCLFPRVNYSIGLTQLIRDGYLLRPVVAAMPQAFTTEGLKAVAGEFSLGELTRLVSDNGRVMAQVADALPRLVGRNKVVWTCVSIEHAEAVAAVLTRAGERAVVVHSKSDAASSPIGEFEHNPSIRHAVSVMMLSEGIDIPAIDAIVLMRPTRSPTLMVQTIGRGLRPYPGQTTCAVLDYGEVLKNCGPLNDPYVRAHGEKRTRDKFTPTIRVCPACLAYVPADMPVCPECGHEDKRVVDRMKALKLKAEEEALLLAQEPKTYQCVSARAEQYCSKAGNDCIRIRFDFKDRITPAFFYGTDNTRSWNGLQKILYQMTECRFHTWRKCFEVCEKMPLVAPKTVTVKIENGFEIVTRIHH